MNISESKTFRVLKKLDKTKRRKFRKFLKSPALNSISILLKAYEFLDKNEAAIKKGTKTDQDFFSFLYGRISYNESNIIKVLNWLLDAYKNFLHYLITIDPEFAIHEDLQELQKQLNIFRMALSMKNNTLLPSLSKKILQKLEKLPKDNLYFSYMARFMEMQIPYLKDSDPSQIDENYFEVLFNHMENYHLLENLRLSCAINNKKRLNGEDPQIRRLEEVRQIKPEKLQVPAINIYYRITQLYQREHFLPLWKELVADLPHYDQFFFPQNLRGVCIALLNLAVHKSNAGHKEFVWEAWNIYQYMIDEEIILEENKVPRADFENIILIGALLGKEEVVRDFYLKYLPSINEQSDLTTRILYEGIQALLKEDYTKAKIKFNTLWDVSRHFTHKLISKTYLLKVDFLLKDYNQILDYSYDAFRMLLSRMQQKTNIPLESFFQFNNSLNQLTKAIISPALGQKELKKIGKNILKEENVFSRQWLISQVEIFTR